MSGHELKGPNLYLMRHYIDTKMFYFSIILEN